MTDAEGNATSPATVRPRPEGEIASSFRLRPERAQVSRLSRRALIGGTALALTLVTGAVFWTLQTSQKRTPGPDELYSTDHHNVADQLAGLPKDYTGIPREVPRLGPPLPGDLGRPIVAAQTQSGPLAVDAEQQRTNPSQLYQKINEKYAQKK